MGHISVLFTFYLLTMLTTDTQERLPIIMNHCIERRKPSYLLTYLLTYIATAHRPPVASCTVNLCFVSDVFVRSDLFCVGWALNLDSINLNQSGE